MIYYKCEAGPKHLECQLAGSKVSHFSSTGIVQQWQPVVLKAWHVCWLPCVTKPSRGTVWSDWPRQEVESIGTGILAKQQASTVRVAMRWHCLSGIALGRSPHAKCSRS